eukprot:511739-Prymnesium_polylepis.1
MCIRDRSGRPNRLLPASTRCRQRKPHSERKKRTQKVAQQAEVAREKLQRERGERGERARVAAEQRIVNSQAQAPPSLMGFMSRAGGAPFYPTKGIVEICPLFATARLCAARTARSASTTASTRPPGFPPLFRDTRTETLLLSL